MKVNYKLMNSLILLSIPIIMIYAILRKPVEMEMQVEASAPVPVPLPIQFQRQEMMQPQPPEYRSPPVKKYKPGHFQQVGILTNEAGETLPLYGREVRNRRDRYHYHTTTQGEQIYPIPVSIDGRECTEDIGCPELYGGETVNVYGKDTAFTVKTYRTDDYF
tara:strand:- start:720 stop:1205 length:486 start_codon:yes stop_codon:yes gene_type:complete